MRRSKPQRRSFMPNDRRGPRPLQVHVHIPFPRTRRARLSRLRERLRRRCYDLLTKGEVSAKVAEGLLHELERRDAADQGES
jgi:hypothetical protein